MLFIKLYVIYFKDFKTTARLAYRLYIIKTLIKSDLYTARYQQRSQEYMSITEYYRTVISYLCMRFINDKMTKKKKKRLSRKVEDTYTIYSEASNIKLV